MDHMYRLTLEFFDAEIRSVKLSIDYEKAHNNNPQVLYHLAGQCGLIEDMKTRYVERFGE